MTTTLCSRVCRTRSVVPAVSVGAFCALLGLISCTSYKVAPDDGGTGGASSSAGGAGSGGTGMAGTNGSGGAAGVNGNGGSSAAGMGGSSGGVGGTLGGSGGFGGGIINNDGGSDRPGIRALGETCSGDQDCSSAHCAGTICCDQSCPGPCAQCSSTGHCQMPADDPACGMIACPADTSCRDWATSITANRCKAIGQCKTAADCSFVNAPAKTYCGLYQGMASVAQVCDGNGTCGNPTVTCGPDGECPVNAQTCCFGGGTACRTGTCNRASATLFGFLDCDEAADCPPSYVCCFGASATTYGTFCSNNCVPLIIATQTQVCNPNTPGECKTGTCTATTGTGPPYFLCM